VQAVLDDPATASRVLVNPHLGELPLDHAIDAFYTADVFMHTWDLARATGQDDRLDPALCAEMLAGMKPLDELLRQSGQYGPKVAVPDDADVQDRMLGFIGRDRRGPRPVVDEGRTPGEAQRAPSARGRPTHSTVGRRRRARRSR
jgi:uncharacterized protein (TIGR03086 family)